eukprot:SAG22_NODE_2108_length_2993_cov_7.220654_1_plen_253_part_00
MAEQPVPANAAGGGEQIGAVRLREAAERGDVAVVQRELYLGAAVDGEPATARTALHRAADRGWVDVVRLLIRYAADVNRPTGHSGETALHLAASRDHTECVRELLKAGSDPALKSTNGWTPLHNAMRANNVDIARLLIRGGANPDEVNASGSTAEVLAFGPDRWRRDGGGDGGGGGGGGLAAGGGESSFRTSSRGGRPAAAAAAADSGWQDLPEGRARIVDAVLSREEELLQMIGHRRQNRTAEQYQTPRGA